MTSQTGIIVVNYGSHRLIDANFTALTAALPDTRVVVVDNFSTEPEADAVERLCRDRDWVLVRRPNIGFGAGMNTGIDTARSLGCDVFVMINPDATATPETVMALAQRASADRNTMVCPVITGGDGGHWFSGGDVLVSAGKTTTRPGTRSDTPTGWLTGACLAVHADLWDRIGGFDDDYFLYWEDVDLSWRCTRAGGRLEVCPDLVVTHDVGGTQKQTGKSPVYCYYNCRNRLLFAAKHLNAGQRRAWMSTSFSYAKQVVYRGGRRAFARAPWRVSWAALSGTLAGLMAIARIRSSTNGSHDVRQANT